MVDYWHYKAVHYWTNVIKRKRTFCLDARFFGIVETFCEKAWLIELIRAEMPEALLHEMQNESVSYRPKLDFESDVADMLNTLWNNGACRDDLRRLLLKVALDWFAKSEREGIGGSGLSSPVGVRKEVEMCIEKGLLVPSCGPDSPPERELFVRMAVRLTGSTPDRAVEESNA